jgi:hypothetical protein
MGENHISPIFLIYSAISQGEAASPMWTVSTLVNSVRPFIWDEVMLPKLTRRRNQEKPENVAQ